MISVFLSRTTLMSAGMIVRMTVAVMCAVVCIIVCAVVCSGAVGQDAVVEGSDAVAWESSIVKRVGQTAQEIAPPTQSANSSIEWTSNIESTAGATAEMNFESHFESRNASKFSPHVDSNAVISPQAFHQAREATARRRERRGRRDARLRPSRAEE